MCGYNENVGPVRGSILSARGIDCRGQVAQSGCQLSPFPCSSPGQYLLDCTGRRGLTMEWLRGEGGLGCLPTPASQRRLGRLVLTLARWVMYLSAPPLKCVPPPGNLMNLPSTTIQFCAHGTRNTEHGAETPSHAGVHSLTWSDFWVARWGCGTLALWILSRLSGHWMGICTPQIRIPPLIRRPLPPPLPVHPWPASAEAAAP